MHRSILTGMALAVAAMPAQAAWKSYIARELGFSFMAPGELKTEPGTLTGEVVGKRATVIYRFLDDDIEYKVIVGNFLDRQADGATILGEQEYRFQDGKKVLTDDFARVDRGKDEAWGRKLVIELPDKSRTTAVFYFTKGRLISLQATVLPANGDFASPDPALFVDSVAFTLSQTEPGAVELPGPKPE